MKSITPSTINKFQQPTGTAIEPVTPFSQQWVTITGRVYRTNSSGKLLEAQHAKIKQKCAELEDACQYKDAKIKDLRKRVFGKKSDKQGAVKSKKGKK